MLTFFEGKHRFCDGMARRDFLKIGGLAMGGLTLTSLLRAEAVAGAKASGKSIINIYLGGGPTHMDTFDLKPEAPSEFRGEFNPIRTNCSGVEICELMPNLATVADKYTIVRSITDLSNEHSSVQSDTGWPERSMKSMGGRPSIGSVMSKVFGAAQTTASGSAPTFVDLAGFTRPGFLGQTFAAYRPDGNGRSNLRLQGAITEERLGDRTNLLGNLDRMRRNADATGMMTAMDSFSERAVGIITSGKLYDALDTKGESDSTLSAYGLQGSAAGRNNTKNFLVARRLVEAGVRCVAFSWGGWDTHGQNFTTMKRQLPSLDIGLAALIRDLEERGLLDDTVIMMSGEFGRTPRINMGAGRDHWPRAGFFFVAGGGMRHGQVIGSTNRLAEMPQDRPVHLQDVFHTVYHTLGIDTNTVMLQDPNGRPQYIVDHRTLIKEMI